MDATHAPGRGEFDSMPVENREHLTAWIFAR